MKKLLSTSYSDNAFNFAMLVQRFAFGFMLLRLHGLSKITGFSELSKTFFDPFHIGSQFSLCLVIFAEVLCAMFVILGLFSRIASLVILVNMAIAVFVFLPHQGADLKSMELGILYLTFSFTLLLVGPGRISVDGMMAK